MKAAGRYLAPDCVLVHEDNPPVKGPEDFLAIWGKTRKAMPGYHKDMQDMMVELDHEGNGAARVWVLFPDQRHKPGVVRDSIDMMLFTQDGLISV